MNSSNHVFHTKHDFTPEFAWAVFQLLAELPEEGVSAITLSEIAKTLASPLVKRTELGKLLGAFDELDIIERSKARLILSPSARALAQNFGRYEHSFYAALHCIYIWKWIWDGDQRTASPSWSYREVCRQILNSGHIGVTADEIVLQVVGAASEQFEVEKVSFSRSSVTGVTAWLEAQTPPLIKKDHPHLRRPETLVMPIHCLRLNLTALCALGKGETELNHKNVQLLAQSLLLNEEEAHLAIIDFAKESSEFTITESTPRNIVFKSSNEPFINWIIYHSVSAGDIL